MRDEKKVGDAKAREKKDRIEIALGKLSDISRSIERACDDIADLAVSISDVEDEIDDLLGTDKPDGLAARLEARFREEENRAYWGAPDEIRKVWDDVYRILKEETR